MRAAEPNVAQTSRRSRQPDKLLPLVADLSQVDPLRAEALLHALPSDEGLPEADWALPFRRRWPYVENAMRWLDSEGLTTPSDRVDAIAATAYVVAAFD